MIKKLSDSELEANLKILVAHERRTLHSILEHINEIDVRKLYLEKAYSSLYDYLIQECSYSGSAAMRRISAARLMKAVPEVGAQIESGHLNLSQVSELSRAIKEKEKTGAVVSNIQKADIARAISQKNIGQTQREISRSLDLELKAPEKTFVQKDESVHLQITLSKEQYQQLLECRDEAASILLSENGDVSLASVIGLLTSSFLHEKKKTVSTTETSPRENKTLTPKTRRNILKKNPCCQFKDPVTGKICGSTFNLEIDHRRSQWAGGNHHVDNLQVLCRAHNNHKYRKESMVRLL
ncbi:hypothetical protein AZI86_01425 [Bdellovibrio bacteriovorus]|uniref:HNH nuclease domain-containing protein n=1 Tax=Bdellovibrio bacteriovorus TaxID=959 RepID=A0A150WNI9_BDEBC|nr:HNH endonuclease signature motif containing protein [Bdellovibrio bacteriovorus]KYG65765.1 hypothetical protein AZI86_01425 [Bdellovibrio bacteriovorus]